MPLENSRLRPLSQPPGSPITFCHPNRIPNARFPERIRLLLRGRHPTYLHDGRDSGTDGSHKPAVYAFKELYYVETLCTAYSNVTNEGEKVSVEHDTPP